MRAGLPQSERELSLLVPAAALALSSKFDPARTIDLVPDAPLFAPLSAEVAGSLPPATLAGELRPADFGPMLTLGASASAPDLLSVGLAVLLHASACLGLLQFSMGGARVDAGYDEEPIEIVMDTAAGASVVEPQKSATEPPADEARAEPTEALRHDAARDGPAAVADPPPREAPPPAQHMAAAHPDGEIAIPAPAPRAQIDDAAREQALAKARQQAERRQRQEQARLAAERAEAREKQRAEKERAQAKRDAQREREQRRTSLAALETNRGDAQAAQPRGGAPSGRFAALRVTEAGGGGFDAASYRAIVARAVKAAVGSKCSYGAGSRVVIALTIGRSGAISGVGIASSSGNGAFDAASLSAVRSAGPFPPPTGRSSVSVPVGVSCR